MKKRLVVKFVVGAVCMVLMVSVLSFSGMTAGAEHPLHTHSFEIKSSYPTGPSISISDSQHRTPVWIIRAECACGAVYSGTGYLDENHSKVWHDLGHVPGTQTHERRVTCHACNYDTIETYYCPGPPCIQ